MKKNIVSFSLIIVFVMYALHQHLSASWTVTNVAANNNVQAQTASSQPIIPAKKTTTTVKPKPAVATPTPVVQSTPPPVSHPIAQKNLYADGTFTGNVADAYYGNIQVQISIQNGKITDVQFLQYPSDRSRSVSINTAAMPILKSEAIAAQSANVDIVSGATDSSGAFQQSLATALAQALN